jgi:molybdopterin-guanine dinucleotide biosynthesis protein MobB
LAETRILAVVGKKGSGKTTLLAALSAEFVRKGRRVMTVKHGAPAAGLEAPGSDTERHFREGLAERSLVVSSGILVCYDHRPETTDPIVLARRYLSGADIVLVEGFRQAPLPKIEVFRRAAGPTPIYDPAAPNASEWVAIVTDDDHFEAAPPVLRFRDTMWLQLVANMAWEKARPL